MTSTGNVPRLCAQSKPKVSRTETEMPWVPLLIRSDVWKHVSRSSEAAGNVYYNLSVKGAILFQDSDKNVSATVDIEGT